VDSGSLALLTSTCPLQCQWHSRPRETPVLSWDIVWYQWHCAHVVCIIFGSRWQHVCSPARVGPRSNSFSVICCWPAQAIRDTWVAATSVCWRHPGLWLLSSRQLCTVKKSHFCVRWRRRLMDAVNWLQLNTLKPDVLWCTSARQQHQINGGLVTVQPIKSVRELGIHCDSDLLVCRKDCSQF